MAFDPNDPRNFYNYPPPPPPPPQNYNYANGYPVQYVQTAAPQYPYVQYVAYPIIPPQNAKIFIDPKEQLKTLERKELRRRTRVASIPCLVLMVFMGLVSTILVYALYYSGMDYESIINLFSDPAVSLVLNLAITTFGFGIPFAIAAKAAKFKLKNIIPLSKPKKGTALPYFFIGVSFCALANILSSFADSFFDFFGIDYSPGAMQYPEGTVGFVIAVLVISIEPALMEEFAFRGIVQGVFRRFGDGFSIMTSAILFGAMHGNFEQIPFAFLVGLVLGFIRIKTESMWIACAVHAFNNLLSVVLDFLFDVSSVEVNLGYTLYLSLALLSGLVGVWMLRRDDKLFVFSEHKIKYSETTFDPENGESVLTQVETTCPLTKKERYKAVFTHPIVIVFLSICVYESIQYLTILG